MTESSLPLAELLAKAGDGDFLRSVAKAVVQLLMETDMEGLIGAGRHGRTAERATYRNGYRDRLLLVSAFAVALLSLLGTIGESLGMDRQLKSNTSNTRTHSLFRQGCMLYELIPTCPSTD